MVRRPSPDSSLAALVPNEVLREMYATNKVVDMAGREHPLHSQVEPEMANALYQLVRKEKPRLVVEVGMAFGGSTLSILQALREVQPTGRLISVDPYQTSGHMGLGVLNVRRCGFEQMHTLIEAPSHAALPRLLDEHVVVDMAYIDGMHTFDYCLMDFFFLDKMLCVGGVVGFNDCGWPSIHRVIRFLKTHRRYRERDVGLQANYRAGSWLKSAARYVLRRPIQDRYFEKEDTWQPELNFYARF